MKKILVFAISFLSITSVFAQSRDGGRNNRYGDYNQSRDVVLGRDVSHNNAYSYSSQRNNDRYDDQRRREEIDQVNRDYDRRINDYRNDRSINVYERDRRIQQAENERKEKLKSFAGGAVLGAVAGVLLGVVLSH